MKESCLMRALCRVACLAVAAVFAVATSSPGAERAWPRWRGPQQDGHTSEQNLPTNWSAKNIVWKTELPGIGQSSPIIWGERIFLTSELGKDQERLVFCVDRATGKMLCRQTAGKGQPDPSHVLNGLATAS